MYAVVAIFTAAKPDARGAEFLQNGIVARVSQEPGYVAGYWTHDGERAYNMLIFDSLEAAEHRADDVRGNSANQAAVGLTPEKITVAEVIAHATAGQSPQTKTPGPQ